MSDYPGSHALLCVRFPTLSTHLYRDSRSFSVCYPNLAMYRTALRSSTGALRSVRPSTFSSAPRRLLSTAPAARKRTWKGAGLRWGLAIAAVYFYNTSPIFADELPRRFRSLPFSSWGLLDSRSQLTKLPDSPSRSRPSSLLRLGPPDNRCLD